MLLGVDIDDDDEGASFGRNTDGAVEPGEQIEARISIQNQGGGANPGDAREVEVRLVNRSEFIDVHGETAFYKNRLTLGEVLEFDVVFAVKKAYPKSDRLLPLELNIREKYGIASVANLSLGIELGKISRPQPPLVVTPKPTRLARARFDRLGSKTKVVFESPKAVEPLEELPIPQTRRSNTLAVIIGMPSVEKAANDAALMKTYFERLLGIPAPDVKVYATGMSRGDLVTLFEQKIANAVDAETDLFVFYSGGGIVDEEGNSYLVPLDGSTTPRLVAQTCYPLIGLYDAIYALGTRSRTIILDIRGPTAMAEGTPFTATGLQDTSGMTTVISHIAEASQGLTAPEGDYGLFVQHFAAGLRGDADGDADGAIKLAEIRDYVRERLHAGDSATPVPYFWTSDGDYDRIFADVNRN